MNELEDFMCNDMRTAIALQFAVALMANQCALEAYTEFEIIDRGFLAADAFIAEAEKQKGGE